MSVKEDSNEFRQTGLNGTLLKLMETKSEGYVLISADGWAGVEVPARPKVGNGPFIYFKRGEPLLRFFNDGRENDLGSEYRLL